MGAHHPPTLQPDLDFTVNEQRDKAIAQVSTHAEDHHPGFAEQAAAFILLALEVMPRSGEALTLMCKEAGIRPHDDRAFGGVYMRLSRSGRIEKCGTVKRTRGHNTAGGNVWRLVR